MLCGRLALGATFVLALPIAGALADEDHTRQLRPPIVVVFGSCPDGAPVRRLLSELVSADEVQSPSTISVQDLGPHYRIIVGTTTTTLDDPARDCAARARQATIVIASDLRAHPQVFGPPTWTIEKGLVFDVASSEGEIVWSPGAEFRGAFGSETWSLYASAGARGPAVLPLPNNWRAELLRFPLDAGARFTHYAWRLRPWFVVGPSLTVTGIIGRDLLQTDRAWRFDLGGLAMVGATLRLFGKIGVAAALSARWQPRNYHLQVSPLGTVGSTPNWWFGVSLLYTIDGKASTP